VKRPIYDPNQAVSRGELFRSIDDPCRIEAFIPPAGKENHAANLCQAANGDWLCVWFSGSHEGQGDVRIALSRLERAASAWSRSAIVSCDAERSEQNPILFQTPQGPLWLLYTAQQAKPCPRSNEQCDTASAQASGPFSPQGTAIIRRRISCDHGQTWGPVETFADKAGSFCRQPPLVLDKESWLLGLYYSGLGAHYGGDYTVVWRTEDAGRTWQEAVVPGSTGRVHASLVPCADGSVLAFMRSRAADRIYVSRSEDGGRSWSGAVHTELPNNNSSIQALRLASGALAMAYNDHSFGEDPQDTLWLGGRYPLVIALSEDDGRTWPWRRVVDLGDGFCGSAQTEIGADMNRALAYPTIAQDESGQLHLAYSYRGRQCIKYVRMDEDWVRYKVSSR